MELKDSTLLIEGVKSFITTSKLPFCYYTTTATPSPSICLHCNLRSSLSPPPLPPTPKQVAGIPLECISVDAVCASVYAKLPEAVITATGPYMDAQLGLGTLMRERMAAMSPSAYEAVLHPIFQVRQGVSLCS